MNRRRFLGALASVPALPVAALTAGAALAVEPVTEKNFQRLHPSLETREAIEAYHAHLMKNLPAMIGSARKRYA